MNASREALAQAARDIFDRGVAAADPSRATTAALSALTLPNTGKIWILGAGKACGPMAVAARAVLGARIAGGAVVVKDGHGVEGHGLDLFEASHPVPDERSVAASRRLISLAQAAAAEDTVVLLLSGGASSLLCSPAPGLVLADVVGATERLLAAGARIEEVNAVRKHLSAVKGGQLLRGVAARVITLAISDVVSSPPSAIGSGPTSPDPTTFSDARDVLEKYAIFDRMPAGVREYIDAGVAGQVPDTPMANDAVFERAETHVIADNRSALLGCAEAAAGLGFAVHEHSHELQGEARDVAGALVGLVSGVVEQGRPVAPPACILAGGETTVTMTTAGRGGRNQELALAAAVALEGREGVLLLSAGTDGTDGPTDAAGAMAFWDTCARAEAAGFEPERHLTGHDAYPLFEALGDLVVTGPTGTNVMDIQVLLVA